ncbi:MAG: hypothetical protein PVSMB4_12350 [Ktedonobacterales bacterium]
MDPTDGEEPSRAHGDVGAESGPSDGSADRPENTPGNPGPADVSGAAPGEQPSPVKRPAAFKLRPVGLDEREVIGGSRARSSYVRMWQPGREFRSVGPNMLEATPYASQPRTRLGRWGRSIKRALLGEPLTTAAQEDERLKKRYALAVLSSDALSSVAYATEAILGVLIVAGSNALVVSIPIAAAIVALLAVVVISYRQTIYAYPKGGGSYIVARSNLGDVPGLVAAASLLVDYTLTVAVSVSAGVLAVTSAFPALGPWKVPVCVAFVVIIALVNLRGVREAGAIFALPTYIFIGSTLLLIGAGLLRGFLLPGSHATVSPHMVAASQGLGVFLILRAFATGCTAMTGVEAISDGVPAFRKPESRNAAITLAAMAGLLGIMFLGITVLAQHYGLEPDPHGVRSVISLLAERVMGAGTPFYYVFQLATMLILTLAANTSFSDFPRLSFFLARDGFAPHQFSVRGDRLAYTTGILTLAGLAALLLVVFQGNTDALLPLYALGVFSGFTLSQSGMVVRWWRERTAGWQLKLAMNGFGALTTATVAAIFALTKFVEGAWIVVLLIPALVLLFLGISRHYKHVAALTQPRDVVLPGAMQHLAIVPLASLNQPTLRALAYACSVSPRVLAVHVAFDEEDAQEVQREWRQRVTSVSGFTTAAPSPRPAGARRVTPPPAAPAPTAAPADTPGRLGALFGDSAEPSRPQLVIIESPYRLLTQPLLRYIDAVRRRHPEFTVTVILPEFVPRHVWEHLLHNQSALRLKAALLFRRDIVVTDVPYHLAPR